MQLLAKIYGITAILIATSALANAADSNATVFTDPQKAGPDYSIQGEYEGIIGEKTKVGGHVIALGEGKFDVVFYGKGLPGAGWDGKTRVVHKSAQIKNGWVGSRVRIAKANAGLRVEGNIVTQAKLGDVLEVTHVDGQWLWFKGKQGWIQKIDVVPVSFLTNAPLETTDGATKFTAKGFTGEIKDGIFTGTTEDGVKYELKKVERKSPTLGAKPPAGAVVLFDGKNVDAWETGKLEEGNLLGVGSRTKKKFTNFSLHLEFRTPFMPTARGQGRGNSGMYIIDQYECQVLDSFGLTGENNECGGIYSISKPNVNMCFPPLAWQTYDVDFQAAKFDDSGKKTANAIVTIKHNGVVIHDKLEFPHATPGGKSTSEKPPGALFLQDHGNPVRYRNIWVVEK